MSGPDTQMESMKTKTRVIVSPLFGVIPLDFLITGEPHPCPYLPGREAREEAFRADEFPSELYHDFMDHGFRRSGPYFYRPVCRSCRACRSIRVPVTRFRLKKSYRRILKNNQDVRIRIGAPKMTEEKHRVYVNYLTCQHNTIDNSSLEDFHRFLYCTAVNTLEFEYRLKGRLMAVGILDLCSRSLSSVYTYFDPEFSSRSPGSFSAIKEILYCRDKAVAHYYLGYYVADCPAMNYKARFKPHEFLDPDGTWIPNDAKGRTRPT